ncbi:MAG: sialidase [Blastopirellula sp.]|nr:MAG: sialidase [Blastopirellula sp.]
MNPRLHCFTSLLMLLLAYSSNTDRQLWADDVTWLKDVTSPKIEIVSDLSSVLKATDGSNITSKKQWHKQRATIDNYWRMFLGPLPQPTKDLNVQRLKTEQLEKCTRTLIQYTAESGRTVKAYLLEPKGAKQKKCPAVVVFHGTNAQTFQKVAGLIGEPERHIGLRLAQRGYVAICPENFLWEEKSYLASTAAAKQRHPNSKGMATMLADGIRAVDVLETLPQVDETRIGAIGHSLGGKETLYLAAFDSRIKAAVASEGGIGLAFTNWDAPWYLGPEIKQANFSHDHHELLALIAPRPFLVLGGETGRGCSDGQRTWPYVQQAQLVCELLNAPVRMGLLNHHQGHSLSWEIGEKAIQWLDVYLDE